MQHVIINDPRHKYNLGTVISAEKANILDTEGVVTIPVDTALFAFNAVSGFFYKSWGIGWDIPVMPAALCKMLMFVVPNCHTINWCAALMPSDAMKAEFAQGKMPGGHIRLVTDSSQAVVAAGLSNTSESVVDLSTMGELTSGGIWIVRARSRIDAPTNVLMGFALYGYSRDVRVLWTAISQTE